MTESNPQSGAVISDGGVYRYVLWRLWDATKPTVLFVMLNPSTADESDDDNTIRRCLGFAKAWGYGCLRVVNLFAVRSRQPDFVLTHPDPVGPQNDRHIEAEAKAASLVVTAWGAHRAVGLRGRAVLDALLKAAPGKVAYLRLTRQSRPEHPLFLPKSMTPVLY